MVKIIQLLTILKSVFKADYFRFMVRLNKNKEWRLNAWYSFPVMAPPTGLVSRVHMYLPGSILKSIITMLQSDTTDHKALLNKYKCSVLCKLIVLSKS